MSRLQALEERRDEITAEMATIASTAGGFNRGFSSGELSRRKALATDLKAVSEKVKEARAAEESRERIGKDLRPYGLFDNF